MSTIFKEIIKSKLPPLIRQIKLTYNSKDSSNSGLSVFLTIFVVCVGTVENMCSGQNDTTTYGSLRPFASNGITSLALNTKIEV